MTALTHRSDPLFDIPVGNTLVLPSASHDSPHLLPPFLPLPLPAPTTWYTHRDGGVPRRGGGAHRVLPISHWQTSLRLLLFPYCSRRNLGCRGGRKLHREEGGKNRLHAPVETTYGTAVFRLHRYADVSFLFPYPTLALFGRPQNKNTMDMAEPSFSFCVAGRAAAEPEPGRAVRPR